MKIEQRKITVVQDVYIAVDGTVFADKYECEEYETKLIEKELTLYGSDFSKTDSIDTCIYARLDTEDLVEKFLIGCNYYGISSAGVTRPGIYMYTGRHYSETWMNLSEIMAKLEENKND